MENLENQGNEIRIEAEDILSGLRNKLAIEIQSGVTMEVVMKMKDNEIKVLKEEIEELKAVITELKQ